MHLYDWFRINEVNDLSDIEIQVARFVFANQSPFEQPIVHIKTEVRPKVVL